MSTWKGKGNSKFKTRHRKMRGGDDTSDDTITGIHGSIQSFQCSDPESHVGGPKYNVPGYNMHASEEKKTPNTSSIKQPDGKTVNTMFSGNTMKMGLFNRRSSSLFTSGPKHLHTLGLIQVITDNTGCNSFAQCLSIFYNDSTGVIHSKTKYVFFGQLDAKGTKNGWGICYDVSSSDAGRIFIGYWNNGTMNGLGIEVDFTYNAADNKHEPVGIYYGHFSNGKRISFGIYHTVASGKETLFETRPKLQGKCILLDKSFDYAGAVDDSIKNESKEGFKYACISSLSLNNEPININRYKTIFFHTLEEIIGQKLSQIQKTAGDEEYHIFLDYVIKYKKFVKFCEGVLDDALKEYDAQKHSEKYEADRKKREKEETKQMLEKFKKEGLITGNIVDKDATDAENEMISSCTTSLTNLGYEIQTPQEIREKEEEEKKQKLAEHEKLTEAKKELEAMKNELEIMQQAPDFLKTMNPGIGRNLYRTPRGRRTSRSYSSSRSSHSSDSPRTRHSVIPLRLFQTLTGTRTPGRTATPTGTPAGTQGTPAGTPGKSPAVTGTPNGGGNLMRKKTRTNKRKKTRKFRKSRRGGRR
jgi:hypothetical protein